MTHTFITLDFDCGFACATRHSGTKMEQWAMFMKRPKMEFVEYYADTSCWTQNPEQFFGDDYADGVCD